MTNYCFVYTSVSTEKWTDDQLKQMLAKSRAQNQLLQITGMLLYLDPYFIQVLEGEEQTVSSLFEKIRQDSRHRKVSLIYKKSIPERLFSDWTMGFNILGEHHAAEIEGFCDFLENPAADYSHLSSDIDNLLKMFRNETLF